MRAEWLPLALIVAIPGGAFTYFYFKAQKENQRELRSLLNDIEGWNKSLQKEKESEWMWVEYAMGPRKMPMIECFSRRDTLVDKLEKETDQKFPQLRKPELPRKHAIAALEVTLEALKKIEREEREAEIRRRLIVKYREQRDEDLPLSEFDETCLKNFHTGEAIPKWATSLYRREMYYEAMTKRCHDEWEFDTEEIALKMLDEIKDDKEKLFPNLGI